ncbi:MAG: bifunctional phosphopantothenoylcysteine decarboxylase/phosphopantothenate--cysteine ligase CoaBC [Asgard group archaeon]|nr:bifunctional phosphopantothenoylcysteine decarboxylase/phosphopantothenate--cysteine ligase CoaBC [Asgard group archaeon]
MSKFKPSVHSSIYEITSTKSTLLAKKRIAIGMTGSVAVLEIVKLARILMRNGATVYAAMTTAARELVQPDLVEWAIGNPVITKLTGQIEHVHLCGQHPDKVDLLLIAPSTANTIGKIANGIDDTVVTTFATTAFGTGIPIAIVPAMHATMYDNPMVIENISKLKKEGVYFIGPRIEEGKAKIATNEEILEQVIGILTPNDYSKKKVVVTAGPTRVWLDDVRFISNPSSGKMGLSIALEAVNRGAHVTLLIGPSNLTIPSLSNLEIKRFETPDDLISHINDLKKVDIFFSAAAIGDYKPEKQKGKITSKQESLSLKLKPTTKIIDHLKKKFPKAQIVGFKAEAGITKAELIKRAQNSLNKYKLELVIANFVDKPDQGFATDTNIITIIRHDGTSTEYPKKSKRELAKDILNDLKSLKK